MSASGDGEMKTIVNNEAYMLPSGESLAHDAIYGRAVAFEGVAHAESGPRDVHGDIHWSTIFPQNIGNKSIAGENQRDINLRLVTRQTGSGYKRDPNGASDGYVVAFDYDFMRRLLDCDPEAEAELVKIAEANPHRKIRYEISPCGMS